MVLLEAALADFEHIANEVGGHRIALCVRGAAEQVYPQPYCYLTTLLVQMHAAGWEDIGFDTIAAVSGASAMFGYEADSFMPKYAFHWRGPDDLVAQATGCRCERLKLADADQAWDVIVESVDSGRPVAGWHGEMMLLAGYREAPTKAQRQVFAMKDGNGYFTEWWSWTQLVEWIGDGQEVRRFAARVEPQPGRDVALRVIRDLVELSAGVPESIQRGFPKARFGLAGIEAYARDCADMDRFDDWGMCHPVNPQWTVRSASAAYLQQVAGAGVLAADASEHVQRAANEYRAAYAAWQETYGLVGYAGAEGAGKVPENRAAAAAAVRQALEHERTAIAELTDALALEGVVPSAP